MSKAPAPVNGAALADAVRRALTEPTPANEIAAVLDRVQQAEDAANRDLRLAEAQALDPLLDADAVGQAWNQAEESKLAARRWAKAVEVLQVRLVDVREVEREAQREKRFTEAVRLRDAVEKDLRERFPALAVELATLLERLEAAERAVAAANRDLPRGASHIVSAEALARGCSPNLSIGINRLTPLCLATRLPSLDGSASAVGAQVWPAARGLAASKAA